MESLSPRLSPVRSTCPYQGFRDPRLRKDPRGGMTVDSLSSLRRTSLKGVEVPSFGPDPTDVNSTGET